MTYQRRMRLFMWFSQLKILLRKKSSFLLSYQKSVLARSFSKEFLTRGLRPIEGVHVEFSPSKEGIPFIEFLFLRTASVKTNSLWNTLFNTKKVLFRIFNKKTTLVLVDVILKILSNYHVHIEG